MKASKLLTLIMVIVMTCTALVSCGSSDLDTGVFSVSAPSGWEIMKRRVDGAEKDDQVYLDYRSCPALLCSLY